MSTVQPNMNRNRICIIDWLIVSVLQSCVLSVCTHICLCVWSLCLCVWSVSVSTCVICVSMCVVFVSVCVVCKCVYVCGL